MQSTCSRLTFCFLYICFHLNPTLPQLFEEPCTVTFCVLGSLVCYAVIFFSVSFLHALQGFKTLLVVSLSFCINAQPISVWTSYFSFTNLWHPGSCTALYCKAVFTKTSFSKRLFYITILWCFQKRPDLPFETLSPAFFFPAAQGVFSRLIKVKLLNKKRPM